MSPDCIMLLTYLYQLWLLAAFQHGQGNDVCLCRAEALKCLFLPCSPRYCQFVVKKSDFYLRAG